MKCESLSGISGYLMIFKLLSKYMAYSFTTVVLVLLNDSKIAVIRDAATLLNGTNNPCSASPPTQHVNKSHH